MSELNFNINACIKSLEETLNFICGSQHQDLSPEMIFSCAAPLIENNRWFAFINLETVLIESINRKKAHIFWKRNADAGSECGIDPWVIETAVELGLITEHERDMVMTEIPGDLNISDNFKDIMNQLQAEVEMLRRCIQDRPDTSQVAEECLTPPPVTPFDMPDCQPEYNERIAAALEQTFNSKIEREISGTLGRIFIFKNQKGTYPERIAVKTIDPKLVSETAKYGAIERFIHEVTHWITYRHSPFIIAPFKTEIVNGWPYIAMPYCECTMREYIDGNVPRKGLPEAISLMVQACCGLQYAKRKGMRSHQDLKPENILLQDLKKKYQIPENYPFLWSARLADFGMANGYLELKLPWGSRPYMAPEQYMKDGITDLSQVDVFACGVMLHELVTGMHPIGEVTSDIWPIPKSGKSPNWRREDKWKKWARSEDKLRLETYDDLRGIRDIIEAALSTNPDDRPSIDSFQQSLLSELKNFDNNAYMSLLTLIAFYHCLEIDSEVFNRDVDEPRYKLDQISEVSREFR
ncbi:protein kinase [bacterium]|nr:protein kinase [bacterium]